MLEDASTPAVILVCHHHVGVGIARTLGRLGVEVYGIDADRTPPAFSSRYCRGRFIWDLHTAPAEDSLNFLDQVSRTIGRRALLIPTSDIGAMLVAEHAGRLANKYIFPACDPALVRSLCNKRNMYHLAKKWNVDTPETAFPRSRDDVAEYLKTARFPILLKPIYNLVPGVKPWRMMIVNSESELLERYALVENPATPNVMLQEYIPGADEMTWTFNGYFDRNSECRVIFTGRKLRNFPPYFGQASLAMCAKNDHVENTTLAFMKAIGYRGALDIGYRYDSRDGKYKVNDINPRVGAMFRVFVDDNGMDVVRALYQHMTGQAVIPARAPRGPQMDCRRRGPLHLGPLLARRQGNPEGLDKFASRRAGNELSRSRRPVAVCGRWMMDAKRALHDAATARRERHAARTQPPMLERSSDLAETPTMSASRLQSCDAVARDQACAVKISPVP
jgi:predicted ATP-grasp superfamily ATP-dependent carboligase